MSDLDGKSPLTGFRRRAFVFFVTASMALATVSLVTALTLTGYALAHGAWALDNISRLSPEDVDRMVALDSLVWAPGLYVICWLSVLDGAVRRNKGLSGI